VQLLNVGSRCFSVRIRSLHARSIPSDLESPAALVRAGLSSSAAKVALEHSFSLRSYPALPMRFVARQAIPDATTDALVATPREKLAATPGRRKPSGSLGQPFAGPAPDVVEVAALRPADRPCGCDIAGG
jgi:hypothetical protein